MKSRATGRRDNFKQEKRVTVECCDPWFCYSGVKMGVKSTEKPYKIYVYLCPPKPRAEGSNPSAPATKILVNTGFARIFFCLGV